MDEEIEPRVKYAVFVQEEEYEDEADEPKPWWRGSGYESSSSEDEDEDEDSLESDPTQDDPGPRPWEASPEATRRYEVDLVPGTRPIFFHIK
jgi:hypothetical protein